MSIVERLREYAVRKGHRKHVTYMDAHGAANLIEQQAERIKELEAKGQEIAKEYVDFMLGAHSVVCTERDDLKHELAALRQRIDDAPVVAHITEDGKVFDNGFVRDTDKPLISKEDLQE